MPDQRDELHQQRRELLESALQDKHDALSRRRFIELLGASLALAGASACAPPRDRIVPYVRPPQAGSGGSIAPLFFATAHVLGGYADGVLVESHMGRPTKVEGNPQHLSSLGGTDAFAQASVLGLYDPNRSQAITFRGQIRTWEDLVRALSTALGPLRANAGQGLRILSESTTSPSLAAQLQQLVAELPNARWHRWQAVNRDNALAGAQLAFGQALETRYHLDVADVVLTLDADPLAAWEPGHLRLAREIARRRQPEAGMVNRTYAVESTWTSIGALADHRLALPARAIEPFAWALAGALGVQGGAAAAGVPTAWLQVAVDDLRSHGRTSVVIPGRGQPPAVHALAHAINAALGGVGTTVEYTDPVEVEPTNNVESLRQLVADMANGQVRLLVILGGNPAYTAPTDVPFVQALQQVPTGIYLGMYDDETAEQCDWHVPELHPLETWTDARSEDGTVTIMQPLIAPLYQGWSAHEVLAAFGDQPETPSHNVVKGFWQSRTPGDFETTWRRMLHDGVVEGTRLPPRPVAVRPDWSAQLAPATWPASDALEVVVRPDPSLLDGRFASNGWLIELPRPFTKLSWDNVAVFSPETARRLGVGNEDVVELRAQGRSLRAPVWVLPGHADGSIGLTLGYGRRRGAGAGNGIGFDVAALRMTGAPWIVPDVEVVKTGDRYALASTQGHYSMEGRDLVQVVSPSERAQDARATESLYPEHAYASNAWGMVIDQSACVGCNACIVACQAENNIPVVGKEEVRRGREMLWLRLDTYFERERALQQLVPCMQCENAPCEVVCPVGATVHSDEGLNDMVYNRCVGTRYCSNNCPYKVRHFNFFEYADFDTPSLKLGRNPEVTVRSRGVMEKCTYCVQRISAARIQAEREGRPIADGEVQTACQAACPAGAIVFGNLNDSTSAVTRARSSGRNYTLLGELNTRPRTTYLAAVRNLNPALGEA